MLCKSQYFVYSGVHIAFFALEPNKVIQGYSVIEKFGSEGLENILINTYCSFLMTLAK